MMRRKILLAEVAAILAKEFVNFLSNFALVEGVAPFLSYDSVGIGKILVSENIAFGGRFSIEHVSPKQRTGLIRQCGNFTTKRMGNQLCYRETFCCVLYRGFQVVMHRQLPKSIVQLEPGIYHPRDADRQDAGFWDRLGPEPDKLSLHLVV